MCRKLVLLAATAGIVLTSYVSGGDDTTPPELKSLRFTPSAIDTSASAAAVTLSFSVTDDISGATYFEACFLDPSGTYRQSVSTKFAPTRAATNSATVTFPRFSNSGAWHLDQVFLSDMAGNTLVLDSAGLSKRGIATRLEVASAKDTVSPKLTALDFSPSAIDTSAGPAAVKVTYSATDDLSGVSHVELSFVSPSGAVSQGGSVKLEGARSTSNSITVTFPRFSEAGHWTLNPVFLADAAGNTLVLHTGSLSSLGFRTSLEVKSAALDTMSPRLTSLHFTPVIDTSQGPAAVKVEFTATDDLSGVKSLEVGFVSPSGSANRSGSAVFSPARELTNSVNVSFPVMSEPGQWTLSTVLLADAAGNTLLLDAEGAARLGLQTTLQVGSTTDTIPPSLTSFRVTPDVIDTNQGPVTVNVDFTASDNLSGVKSVEVVFASPSGNARQSGSAVVSPSREAAASMRLTFPQASEPGVWKVDTVIVTDVAGNTLVLDQAAMASRVVKNLQVR